MGGKDLWGPGKARTLSRFVPDWSFMRVCCMLFVVVVAGRRRVEGGVSHYILGDGVRYKQ